MIPRDRLAADLAALLHDASVVHYHDDKISIGFPGVSPMVELVVSPQGRHVGTAGNRDYKHNGDEPVTAAQAIELLRVVMTREADRASGAAAVARHRAESAARCHQAHINALGMLGGSTP